MSICRALQTRGLVGLFTGVLALVSSFAYASPGHSHSDSALIERASDLRTSCEAQLQPLRPLTLRALRELNTAHLKDKEVKYPAPAFANLQREVTIEQVGEKGPLALQGLLGRNESFVMTPAPTAPMDTAVYLHEEGKSFSVHIDQEWLGRRTSTTVYASLPKTLKPHDSGFLVGEEYPVVLVHLHGGGTPTATGKNGMSIGHALAPVSIPVLALDLPGHGQATRQLNGLTTFEGQVDWILKIIDQLVDPRVKIVISGHSWGGEFAVYMQRHSHEPKYARIAAFIAASPPVDVSLGGDEAKKLEFEKHFQENFAEYESRIAPADFKFHQNLLQNGKISDVGSYFTAFTSMDYKTPRLTPEQQAGLKPLYLWIGEKDGMCYVGREDCFQEGFGNLIHGEFIVLEDGMTWKGLEPTGHNLWDRYLDGTTHHEVYGRISKIVKDAAGPQGMGSDEADNVVTRVNDVFRAYSNFFLFREMVRHHVEYIHVPTPARETLDLRKVEIETFLNRVDAAENQARNALEGQIVAAMTALRTEIGLGNISPDRAREELFLPELTDDRRTELELYRGKVDGVDASLQGHLPDPDFDQDLAALRNDYSSLIAELGLNDITEYKPKYDEYTAKKGSQVSPSIGRIRASLSKLHQVYMDAYKRKQNRFGRERDRQMSAIPLPAGIHDFKMALRELNAERSPDRRAKLQELIDRAPNVEATVRNRSAADLLERLNELPLPAGVDSIAAARALKIEQDAIRAFTWAPPGDSELTQLATRIADLTEERRKIHEGSESVLGLDRLDKVVREGIGKRISQFKAWETLWKRKEPASDKTVDRAKPILSSPRLRELEQEVEAKLKFYRELYYSYEYAKGDWLLQLKRAGNLNEASILAGRPDLRADRLTLLAAKQSFEEVRDQVDELRWQEAIDGHLDGAPDAVLQEATAIARGLWGKSRSAPTEEGSIHALRAQEDQLEALRREESLLHQRLDQNIWEYTELMAKRGHVLPIEVRRVSIMDALNLSYPELIAKLREDPAMMEAFRSTLKTWSQYLGQLRKEAQSKDVGNY